MPVAPLTDDEITAKLAEIDERRQGLRRQMARLSLLTFTRYTNPYYEANWHHIQVAAKLDRVLSGACRRLMIFLPPQNGKSELVSRRFPAYAFGTKPDLKIIATSYNMSLAEDMSRDVQKIISCNEYRELFPHTNLAAAQYERDPETGRRTHAEKRTQGQFDIVGRRGAYYAAGVGGPITGKTADIGIIDDPVKNRAEAESELHRDRVWEWYKSAFTTRQFGSDGAIIICLTRWHEDDLAGRLLALAKEHPDADQWEVVSLPAILETPTEGDPRAVGEALWPSKYPLEELTRRRAMLGEYDWASLYMQQPAPSGGGLFKMAWFADKIVDAAPARARRARGWDTAGTEGDGDWTVGVKIAEADGIFYIEDVQRAQLGPSGVDGLIRAIAALDGAACAQREEREGGSSGLAVIEARAKALKGYDYAGVSITGNKVTRARPFRAQCEAGNVRLVRGPWNAKYLDELCAFPTGRKDDQVDASSCAFNAVLLEPPPPPSWVVW